MKKWFLLCSLMLVLASSWAVTVTIGTGTSTDRYPLNDFFHFARSQCLYLASEVSVSGTITNLRWYRDDTGADPEAIATTQIWLNTVPDASLTSADWGNEGTLVAEISNLDLGDGNAWVDIDITDYDYDPANGNLLVSVYTQDAPYTLPHSYWRYTSTSPNYLSRLGESDSTNPPSMSTTYVRPNIQLIMSNSYPEVAATPSPVSGATNVPQNGLISWAFGAQTETYDLYFGTPGNLTMVQQNATAGVTGQYEYSNLLSGTQYAWYVVTRNTATRVETTGPTWTFTTAYSAVSEYPYEVGFEDSVPPGGWTVMTVADPGTDPVWSQVSTGGNPACNPHGGTYMAKFNSFNCADGAELRLQSRLLNLQEAGISTPQISFYMVHDTGYSSYLTEGITIQTSTDGTNWTNASELIPRYDANFETPDWVQHTVMLPEIAGQNGVYVGILAHSLCGNHMYIDDVTIGAAPTGGIFHITPSTPAVFADTQINHTSAPQEFVVSNVGGGPLTITSVAITGTNANQFQLTDGNQYPAVLTIAGNITFSVSFAPNSVGTKTAQLEVTDTLTRTVHTYDLSGICYDDPTITTFPYEQGFEGAFMPVGWAQVIVANPSNDDPLWSQETEGDDPLCEPHGGTYMIKFNSYSVHDGGQVRLQTPDVNFTTVESASLSFFMIHDSDYENHPEEGIQVQVSTNGTDWTDLGDRVCRFDSTLTDPAWSEHTFDLTAYAGQTVKLGLLAISQYGNNFFVDDLSITTGGAPQIPNPATIVSPADNAVEVPANTNLTWAPGTGPAPDGYRLYFGTNGGGTTTPTNLVNGMDVSSDTSYNPSQDLEAGVEYFWQVIPYIGDEVAQNTPIWSFTVEAVGNNDGNAPIPVFGLKQNMPNPFNPTTTIKFSVAKDGPAELSIFNVRGERVKTLVKGELKAGFHQVTWNGDDQNGRSLSSGMYFCRFTAEGKTAISKATLLK
jgi:hypothetical protein